MLNLFCSQASLCELDKSWLGAVGASGIGIPFLRLLGLGLTFSRSPIKYPTLNSHMSGNARTTSSPVSRLLWAIEKVGSTVR